MERPTARQRPKPQAPGTDAPNPCEPQETEGDCARPAILVVDDEEGIRDAFREVLTIAGYKVHVAADGKQAMAVIGSTGDVGLIITDLIMPNREGVETILEIRRRYPMLKIIAMSGALAGELTAVKTLGADIVLAKPVASSVLRRAVSQLLA